MAQIGKLNEVNCTVFKSPFSLSVETDDFYLQCFFLWHSVEDLAILSGSGSQQFSDMGAVSVSIAHNRAVEARKKWFSSSQFTPFPFDRSDFLS